MNSHKRTTQFLLHDMQFHDAWGILPFESSAQKFLQVTVVTFFLDTQKNSVQVESIPIEAICLAFVTLCGRRQSNLFISVFMRLTFIPLYAPTFLRLEVLDGWSPAKMLWLSSACGRRTSFSSGWGSTLKNWPPFSPFWWVHDTAPRRYL